MNKLDDKLKEFLKLVATCEWNNLDYRKVPAYISIKNDIIKIAGDFK